MFLLMMTGSRSCSVMERSVMERSVMERSVFERSFEFIQILASSFSLIQIHVRSNPR